MDSAGTALSLPQATIRKVRVEILGLEDYWKLHLPRPAILKPGASESSPEGFNTPNAGSMTPGGVKNSNVQSHLETAYSTTAPKLFSEGRPFSVILVFC